VYFLVCIIHGLPTPAAVNVVSTFVSILSVDKFGRRFLFLEGGCQMAAAQVRVAAA
jgi:hypothetical protein